MATITEVQQAFHFLLGRAPSAEEANVWVTIRSDALRGELMATEEFRTALPGDAIRMPLNLPVPESVWSVDDATAAALLARVQAHWIRLGEERPYWSSDMRPEFTPENFDANRELFVASGQGEVSALVTVLARYGYTPDQLPRVFEFGCGAGRIVGPLARAFKYVTGCDISPRHLALARAGTGARVNYALATMPHFGMVAPFDLWFSTQTLQHNPPPLTALILRRAFALLAPGGVAVFQLPTERAGYRFEPLDYLAAANDPATTEIHALPQAVVFALALEAGCRPVEVREDGLVWPPTACLSNRFIIVKPRLAAAEPSQPLARR